MTGRSTLRRAAALSGTCCLLLAGCSGSATPTATSLSPIVVQPADFPASWQHRPDTSISERQADILDNLAKCTGVQGGKVHPKQAQLRSDVYTHGELRIFATATAYPDPFDVSRRIATLGLPKADPCLGEVLAPVARSAVPGAIVVSTAFTALAGAINTAANVGGSSTGYAVVEKDGRKQRVYIDTSFITGATTASVLVFSGVGARVPAAVRHPLVLAVAARALPK